LQAVLIRWVQHGIERHRHKCSPGATRQAAFVIQFLPAGYANDERSLLVRLCESCVDKIIPQELYLLPGMSPHDWLEELGVDLRGGAPRVRGILCEGPKIAVHLFDHGQLGKAVGNILEVVSGKGGPTFA